MTFDGRDYQDYELGFPNLYQPLEPLVGGALSKALRIAYLLARKESRRILEQHDAMDFRNPGATLARAAMNAATFTRVAEGFRYIPDEFTHLVGIATFFIPYSPSVVNVHHRLTVVGGANDISDDFVTQMAPPDDLRALPTDPRQFGNEFSIYEYANNIGRATFEVELSNAPAGALREVYVEAYAQDDGGNTVTYMRQHVQVDAEVRG